MSLSEHASGGGDPFTRRKAVPQIVTTSADSAANRRIISVDDKRQRRKQEHAIHVFKPVVDEKAALQAEITRVLAATSSAAVKTEKGVEEEEEAMQSVERATEESEACGSKELAKENNAALATTSKAKKEEKPADDLFSAHDFDIHIDLDASVPGTFPFL